MPDLSDKERTKRIVAPIVIGVVVIVAALVMWTFSGSGRGYPVEPTGTPVTEQTRIGLSTRLQVVRDGDWYEALVLRINKNGTFKVHYDGWDSRFDEDVPRSRMRLAPVPKGIP